MSKEIWGPGTSCALGHHPILFHFICTDVLGGEPLARGPGTIVPTSLLSSALGRSSRRRWWCLAEEFMGLQALLLVGGAAPVSDGRRTGIAIQYLTSLFRRKILPAAGSPPSIQGAEDLLLAGFLPQRGKKPATSLA